MRRLAAEAGLTLPEFHSSRESDEFRVTLFLHNLLTEDDHAWLRSLTTEALDSDEVKVLIYARATGAVDNTACRDFTGLDTLSASRALRRLRDRGLLVKQGAGSRTHYALVRPSGGGMDVRGQVRLPLETPADGHESPYGVGANPHMLGAQTPYGLHEGIPEELLLRLQRAGKKPRQAVLRDLIQDLCRLRPFTANELSALLGGRDAGELKRLHLKPMRNAGILTLLFPESEKHPHQAYLVADQDKKERARDT
jgi:ATP-dependent DNA helicase RecG